MTHTVRTNTSSPSRGPGGGAGGGWATAQPGRCLLSSRRSFTPLGRHRASRNSWGPTTLRGIRGMAFALCLASMHRGGWHLPSALPRCAGGWHLPSALPRCTGGWASGPDHISFYLRCTRLRKRKGAGYGTVCDHSPPWGEVYRIGPCMATERFFNKAPGSG